MKAPVVGDLLRGLRFVKKSRETNQLSLAKKSSKPDWKWYLGFMSAVPETTWIRGSARAYSGPSQPRVFTNASWPWGLIRISEKEIQLKLFRTIYCLMKPEIEKIHWYKFPRPYIRLYHSKHEIPIVLLFGTFRSKKLKSALLRNGFTIEAEFWLGPLLDK